MSCTESSTARRQWCSARAVRPSYQDRVPLHTSDAGREKLRRFGLAPPPRFSGDPAGVAFFDLAECPRCGSTRTSLRNAFGPTLCRMIWYCHDCQDAFEQFKAL